MKLFVVACFLVAFVLPQVSSRTFYFTSYCSDTLWFIVTSGAASYANNATKCASNTDCVSGSTCNVNNGICYWTVPTPSKGVFRLDPNGGTNSLTFPVLNNGQSVVWSGNIGACLNGTCSSTPSSCDSAGCGVADASPMTRAEFTLSKSGTDFYDVEVINGFNVGVEINPRVTSSSTSPYICGNPGGRFSKTGTANCTWTFTPPQIYYNWVQTGGVACTSNSDCSSYPGTVCGLSNNVGQSTRFQLTCGSLLGYWTADQICGVDQTFGSPFNCNMALNAPNSGKVLSNLYACDNGIPSCYQNGAVSDCCGCVNWNTIGLDVPASTQQCVSTNPNWNTYVQPTLTWLKRGCASAYTFPYDDMSSTFTCSQISQGYNVLNYDIVFCPERVATATPQPSNTAAPPIATPQPSNTAAPPTATSTPTTSLSNATLSPLFSLNYLFILSFLYLTFK